MKTRDQLQKKYLGRRVKTSTGYRGVVTAVRGPEHDAPISVSFPDRAGQTHFSTHQLTLLKPKKPKPVPREIWVNEYVFGLNTTTYLSEEEAQETCGGNALRCVRFKEVIE